MHNKSILGRKVQISFTKSKIYWSYLSILIFYSRSNLYWYSKLNLLIYESLGSHPLLQDHAHDGEFFYTGMARTEKL